MSTAFEITGLVLSLGALGLFSVLSLLSTRYFPIMSGALFVLTAVISMFAGCNHYDSFVNSAGLGIGLALILYSYMCFGAGIYAQVKRVIGGN